MRSGFFVFLLLMLCPWSLPAQWTLLNPLPTIEHLTALYFIDEQTGYIVGEHGTVIRTLDGGETWTSVNAGISWTLNDVTFTSATDGIVVGELGTILKTTDAGVTWLDVGNYDPPLKSVEFPSEAVGYAVGLGGTVVKTTDEGFTWQTCPPVAEDLFDVSFVNEQTGYACGANMYVIKTTDGGSTWSQLPTGLPLSFPLYCLDFLTETVGFAGGGEISPMSGVLIKTTDGGTTWTQVPSFSNSCQKAIQFLSTSTGYVMTGFKCGKRTTDGGNTWSGFCIGGFSQYWGFNIFFVDEERGFACGDYGQVYLTENEGDTWVLKSSSLREDLFDISFPNEITGFVAADQALYRSADGGSTWNSVFPDTNGDYHISNISFPNTDTGYLSTWNQLWRSTNSGENWITLPTSTATTNMTDICFTSGLVGYICGYYGNVWMTHDGGNSWESSPTNPSAKGMELFFLSPAIGYLLCNDGSYYKTSDAGEMWTHVVPTLAGAWQSICFADELHGYLGGYEGTYTLIKTVDGGMSWTNSTASGMHDIFDLKFFSATNGYAMGDGVIYHTTDGGGNWIPEVQLDQITFKKGAISSDNIFVVGSVGTIMKRADSIATGLTNPSNEKQQLIIDCFPNPMADYLHITCQLPQTNRVTLNLYSNLGQPVQTIDLGNCQAGKFSYDLDDLKLPPGLYLLQFTTGELTTFRKIMKFH
ncbi:MAG: T9SS type A sorting domain-containing protein [Bacteroidales bacterium]|nr:T9SS type A sorting domain-containing protein [Bacteroidales bacterium]